MYIINAYERMDLLNRNDGKEIAKLDHKPKLK